jgi:glycosyltransferase involved in cell wall biosynthesis
VVKPAPRVSVITPAFNAAATLPETLASVQAQTFTDWEVVLVDDASDDGTGMLATAADERVRVLRNETSTGPAAARNRALQDARGELIAVLDADDLLKPTYLERQIAVYEAGVAAGRRVGAVCCDAELEGPEGSLGLWSDRVGRVERVDLAGLLLENTVWVSILASRAALLDIGGYHTDPGGDRISEDYEDYDLSLRLLEAGWEIVVNPETLGVYRLRDAARSSQIAATAEAGTRLLDRALARGALSPAQRRIAVRRRRLFEIVRRRAVIAGEPRPLPRLAQAARLAPLVAVSVLENPQRWRHWLTRGPRTAGPDRHTSR